jgi:hypothetical protein
MPAIARIGRGSVTYGTCRVRLVQAVRLARMTEGRVSRLEPAYLCETGPAAALLFR